MKITVNGKAEEVSAKTIAELATLKNVPAKGVAITMNGTVIPRKQWEATTIMPDADIIIIKAFAGG